MASEPEKAIRKVEEWTIEAERDLLLFVVAIGKFGNGRVTAWNTVHTILTNKGYKRTLEAFQRRWRTLRKDSTTQAWEKVLEKLKDDIAEAQQEAEIIQTATESGFDVAAEAGKEATYETRGSERLQTVQGTARNRTLRSKSVDQGQRSREKASAETIFETPAGAISETRTKEKGKGKAARTSTMTIHDSPILTDISDLLPIIDSSGRVRGFMTLEEVLTRPDVNSFEPKNLIIKDTIKQQGHSSITVRARLAASDALFKSSKLIQPIPEHPNYQTPGIGFGTGYQFPPPPMFPVSGAPTINPMYLYHGHQYQNHLGPGAFASMNPYHNAQNYNQNIEPIQVVGSSTSAANLGGPMLDPAIAPAADASGHHDMTLQVPQLDPTFWQRFNKDIDLGDVIGDEGPVEGDEDQAEGLDPDE